LRLLVSVRNPDEVEAALSGGADIIDAKDPVRGPLGPVAHDVLRAIDARVPPGVPLSVALGDDLSAESVGAAIAELPIRRRAEVYVKVGFPGPARAAEFRTLLSIAASAAARHPTAPRLVAVVYADRNSDSAHSARIPGEVRAAGVAALLVDTAGKDGRSLLDWWPEQTLRDWLRAGRDAGLELALAGSLGRGELTVVAALAPDIIGVRGAACLGGRTGSVDATRVRSLRAALLPPPLAIAANHQSEGRSSHSKTITK
jgi:(5-formylfuran-3-yl)methyl phosphate synthase